MAEIKLSEKQIIKLVQQQQVVGSLENELVKTKRQMQDIVEIIADAHGVELVEGTSLDLQKGVLILPDSKSDAEEGTGEESGVATSDGEATE